MSVYIVVVVVVVVFVVVVSAAVAGYDWFASNRLSISQKKQNI